MSIANALYAQSGGVTAVINATACGVIETARANATAINQLFAAKNGILGVLNEDLIITNHEHDADIKALLHTPSSAFGSCRYKLADPSNSADIYARLLQVITTHNIRYFFYNGGGDSQDTTHKIAQLTKAQGIPLQCIGIPKTIDNDLAITDNSPGFGSVAKYVAVSILEASMDIAAMAASSTKIFLLEVMGRHAGWIAAAAGLAAQQAGDPPQIILLPEIAFDEQKFLARVKQTVAKYGYCSIVVSEGVRYADGNFVAKANSVDAFGHKQLGGAAPVIAQLIQNQLGYKYHWAVADYLQRSARHIASATDVAQAYAVGKAAVEFALAGENDIMPIIVRHPGSVYNWSIAKTNLALVANSEVCLPRHYISDDGFGITQACRDYLLPLIQGEAYPPFNNGLPAYVKLQNKTVQKQLPAFNY
jgi:6-phosphofructokinase 1